MSEDNSNLFNSGNIYIERPRWYIIRTARGHEQSVESQLRDASFEVFLPMRRTFRLNPRGERVESIVPCISGYVFVRGCIADLLDVSQSDSADYSIMRNSDRTSYQTVPDAQMDCFISSVRAGMKFEIINLSEHNVRLGERVLVTRGTFAGFQGTICRIDHGCKRVMIQLTDFLAACTVYVPRRFLEYLPSSDDK